MQKSVFICDDDADILDICKMILESENTSVVTCPTAASLYENLATNTPNLIFIDNGLSGTSGQDVILSLKQDDRYKAVPILLFSANADIERIAASSGANGYLAKPFDISELKKVVDSYLR